MNDAIETLEVSSFSIGIFCDPDPQNPREDWDHQSTLVIMHRNLAIEEDKGEVRNHFDGSWQNAYQRIGDCQGGMLILPVFLLDHSGITISTTDFRDSWDSGQSGFIWQTEAQIREQFLIEAGRDITVDEFEHARNCLKGEIEEYNQYVNGEIFGYVLSSVGGKELESCWGFYGLDCCKREAIAAANAFIPDPAVVAAAVDGAQNLVKILESI